MLRNINSFVLGSVLLLDLSDFLFRMGEECSLLDGRKQNKNKTNQKNSKNYGLEFWVLFGTKFYFPLNKDSHVTQPRRNALTQTKEKYNNVHIYIGSHIFLSLLIDFVYF